MPLILESTDPGLIWRLSITSGVTKLVFEQLCFVSVQRKIKCDVENKRECTRWTQMSKKKQQENTVRYETFSKVTQIR